MQTAKNNNPAFSPFILSAEQMAEPLNVLYEFFSDDTLSGHLQRLKDWRDSVLADDFYRDMKGSPGGLLYFYELNISLLQTAHLLKTKDINLSAEKDSNEHYSIADNLLNTAELHNPLLVFKSAFDRHDLSWYGSQLWEWLEHGLSVKAAREFIETPDLVFLYESIQRLYAAAWIICKRAGYKDMMQCSPVDTSLQGEQCTSISLYRLSNITSYEHAENIKAIISKIKHKLPSAQAIIDLGSSPSHASKIFLLVLTADEEKDTALNLCSMFEESCNKIADLTVLVHYATSFISGLNKGHRFFRSALKCPVVYLSGDLLLPGIDDASAMPDDCLYSWQRWFKQGGDFLTGAEFFVGRKDYDAALFCLHQCAESLLTAIIRACLGYRVNNHNLTRLLKLTQFFTDDIAKVFIADEQKYFEVLKCGYIDVRYKDNFTVDAYAVEALLPIVGRLKDKTSKVYNAYLLLNTI